MDDIVSGPPIMNNPRTQPHNPGAPADSPRALGRSVAALLEGEALFLASLPVIDDVTGQVCRRHRLSAAEADDFRSEVRLHFIDRDYEVLRRFEKRSSLPTYVTVVIQRLFLDYRNRLWGKWRPTTEAKRLGPTAILIERLVARDGWSLEQVVETLRVNHGLTLDASLEALCDKLTRRAPKRQMVAETHADGLESQDPSPDANVVRVEQEFLAKRVRVALERAKHALEPEERLILKMRFEDAVPVADIARALHLNQKRLYRTIERLLASIGERLEAEGVSREDARQLFTNGTLDSPDDDHDGHDDHDGRSDRGSRGTGNDKGTAAGAALMTGRPWRRL
jgi:RNA polymerase sigma factor (sigma-70 family)